MNATEPDRPFRIVILGGGTAGWMTAAALSRRLDRAHFDITTIESTTIGTVGVGEATIPLLRQYNNFVGLAEADFLVHTQATFKLGICFEGWTQPQDKYLHPFVSCGEALPNVPLMEALHRLMIAGKAADPQDYLLPTQLYRASKFLPGRPPSLPDEDAHTYAYHIDSTAYGQLLKRLSLGRGVRWRDEHVEHVQVNGDGLIESLQLASGEALRGDFFIDCSGFRSVLLGGALKSKFDDWTHWLPCNRAMVTPTASTDEPRPYTRAIAHRAGWRWQIPLRQRCGNGLVYCSDFLGDDAATAELGTALPEADPANFRRLMFTTGAYREQWRGNCVAVGLAGGFLEPLESTSIYLIQVAVNELLRCFPAAREDAAARTLFNQRMADEYAFVRDFLVLHYHLNQRLGEPFWDACRTAAIPSSLEEKLELYRESGFIAPHSHGLFHPDSWQMVLAGHGCLPRTPSLAAAQADSTTLMASLTKRRQAVMNACSNAPHHADVLRRLTQPGGQP